MRFPIRTVIIDDDRPSIEVLQRALEKQPDVEVLGTADSIETGISLISHYKPDLIFLDIEFPEATAIDVMEEMLTGAPRRVVFYSSYRKYLMKALRLNVFDFLLKPFDSRELDFILSRYRLDRNREQPFVAEPRKEFGFQAPDGKPIAITTATNDRIIVAPASIVYFRYDSDRKIWEVVLNTLKRYILKRQNTAETILSYSRNFVRTHKSYIVNLSYLALITPTECRLLPPLDHIDEIKISKSYRRDLLDRFYDI